MKTRILSILCLLTCLIFIIMHGSHQVLPQFITKALIMPWLMVIFIINLRHDRNRLHILMFSGLFFSWVGDVLLEIPGQNELMFIAGLAGFLLAHVMYLVVFFSTPGKNSIFGKRFYLLLPVVAFGLVFILIVWNDLGKMLIPVIVYAIVMLIMLSGAINRIEKVNRTSFIMVLAGAILFVISDSFLAIGKFIHPFYLSTIAVMTTYVAAQLLITIGYVRQFRINEE